MSLGKQIAEVVAKASGLGLLEIPDGPYETPIRIAGTDQEYFELSAFTNINGVTMYELKYAVEKTVGTTKAVMADAWISAEEDALEEFEWWVRKSVYAPNSPWNRAVTTAMRDEAAKQLDEKKEAV